MCLFEFSKELSGEIVEPFVRPCNKVEIRTNRERTGVASLAPGGAVQHGENEFLLFRNIHLLVTASIAAWGMRGAFSAKYEMNKTAKLTFGL